MSIDTSFTQMDTDISLFLHDAYPALVRSTVLQIILIAAASLAVGFWLRKRLLGKPAPTHRDSADKEFHYILPVILVLLLILRWSTRNNAGEKVLFALSLLTVLPAIYFLLSWRRIGVPLAIAGVWMTLPLQEIPLMLSARVDWLNISGFSLPGKVGVFAADRYIFGGVTALALLAGILTAVIIRYYTYRRFFFKENEKIYFSGVSVCPKCGRILTGDGKFCTACGTSVEGLPRSRFAWEEVEDPAYCPNCGHDLRGRSVCLHCGAGKELKEIAKDETKDAFKSQLVKYGVLGLVVLIVFLPLFSKNAIGYLTKGSAKVSNAFTEKFNDWYQDAGCAEDPAWLADFDAANQTLFDFNARGFTVIPERLSYSELYIYLQYLDASYYQMVIQQEVSAAVHAGDTSRKAELAGYYNETMNLQAQALGSGMMMLFSSKGIVGKLQSCETILVDGIRFLLSFVPGWLFSLLLAAAAGFGIFRGIVLTKKHPAAVPLEYTAAETEDKEALDRRRKEGAAARKKDRLYTAIGVSIAVIFIAGEFFSVYKKADQKIYTYESAMNEAFTMDGALLSVWFYDCNFQPETALAEKDEVLPLLDGCCNALDYLQQAQAPEDMKEHAEFIEKTAAELTAALRNMQNNLESGSLPSREEISLVSELLQSGMERNKELQYHSAMNALEDLF